MENIEKFWTSLFTLRNGTECTVNGDVLTEDDFNNNVQWVTGTNENGTAIHTNTCPHSEITWTLLKAEMDSL